MRATAISTRATWAGLGATVFSVPLGGCTVWGPGATSMLPLSERVVVSAMTGPLPEGFKTDSRDQQKHADALMVSISAVTGNINRRKDQGNFAPDRLTLIRQ